MGLLSFSTWLFLFKVTRGREQQLALEMGWQAAGEGRLSRLSVLISTPFLWTMWAVTFLALSAASLYYHPQGLSWPLSIMSPLVARLSLTAVVLFGVVCQCSLFVMYGRCAVAAQNR